VSVLVLAIGNPQREDDGVAWKLAETIPEDRLDVRRVHQLVPELALDVSRAEAVLFIDAKDGGEPGTVRLSSVEPGPDRTGLTHAISPRALLFYADTLFGRAPRAHLLTVTGERFGHGEGLSTRVQETVAALTPAGISFAP
jgi:hydrogenase maturation protease